ncbi:hypothetical protein ANRL4_01624 [Anaerolineae bacterium]|nr:hypothetical protein ANRL4_01624 [Anaerolineae bacterium]
MDNLITGLRLVNFKAFKDQHISFRPLTLLTGMNGMGKSSVLQALLLLRQQNRAAITDAGGLFVLNGDLVQLGTGQDVLFEGAENDVVEIEVHTTELNDALHWVFHYEEDANALKLSHFTRSGSKLPDISSIGGNLLLSSPSEWALNMFAPNFQYLQAERFGPRTLLPYAPQAVGVERQLGMHGEHVATYLYTYGAREVELPSLYHPQWESAEGSSPQLRELVELWMNEISPGTRISLHTLAEVDAIRLSYSFQRTGFVTRDYRPTNVGFGISYTLPILVALLGSEPGALILLENPEAHLHPRGQVRIGELMARAAAAGIQVVVETHSDHVLNGIRVAVRQGIVTPDQVALHFFQRPEEDDGTIGVEVVTPEIDEDGRIDYWPEGFFDEYGKSLRSLL